MNKQQLYSAFIGSDMVVKVCGIEVPETTHISISEQIQSGHVNGSIHVSVTDTLEGRVDQVQAKIDKGIIPNVVVQLTNEYSNKSTYIINNVEFQNRSFNHSIDAQDLIETFTFTGQRVKNL